MSPHRSTVLRWLVVYTFAWVLVYAPLETFVTVRIAGMAGLLYGGYLMNVVGMALMLWSAVAGWRRRVTAPGLLAVGWSWTAATFWRATSDRFRFAELNGGLSGPVWGGGGGGEAELWAACVLTALACAGMAVSLHLVLNTSDALRSSS